MKEHPDFVFAYMAGIIDGEGCFSIFKLGKDYKTRQRDYLAAKLTIVNTDKPMLDWIVEHFGGKYRAKKGTSKSPKTCFYWHAHGERLDYILDKCMPFFTAKLERAKLLREFRKTFDSKRWVSKPTTEEIHNLRFELKVKLHTLNKHRY